MKQHFKVGELVVIQSGFSAGHVCTVLEHIESDCGISRHGRKITNMRTYRVSIKNSFSDWHTHKNLRKYHPPSTKTFDEIMQELKKPVKA